MDRTDILMEGPLPSDLIQEVKHELEEAWHFHRTQVLFRGNIRRTWLYRQRKLDDAPPQLNHSRELFHCYNKHTALYVAPPPAETRDNTGAPIFVLRIIYKLWLRFYNNKPKVDYESFFAEPVGITPSGPATVAEIAHSHIWFCDYASQFLDELGRGEAEHCSFIESHKLFPLFRAIVLILDENFSSKLEDDDYYLVIPPSQAQTVLMVRTGDESGLVAPISFEQIRAQTLPLKRDDCALEDIGIEVVRVSLATAVDFICSLQQSEEAASLIIKGHAIPTQVSLCPSWPDDSPIILTAEGWAEKVLQKAESAGFHKNSDAGHALRRALAARRGEIDDGAQLIPPYEIGWGWG